MRDAPDVPEEPEPEPEPPVGRIAPTGVGPLIASGVVGLVGGWAVRPLSIRLGYAEPKVPLVTIALLLFVAAVMGGSAYLTGRAVRASRHDLLPHQAVNRLVLGKACALAGAVIGGAYLGYALAQLGVGDPAAHSRLWRSLVAGVSGIALSGAALLLEQACRVPKDRD